MEQTVTREELEKYLAWCERVLAKKPDVKGIQNLKKKLEEMLHADEKAI